MQKVDDVIKMRQVFATNDTNFYFNKSQQKSALFAQNVSCFHNPRQSFRLPFALLNLLMASEKLSSGSFSPESSPYASSVIVIVFVAIQVCVCVLVFKFLQYVDKYLLSASFTQSRELNKKSNQY